MHLTPQSSQRARGVEVWAALAALGRDGVADLVDRTCRLARRFADGMRQAGYDVPNEVVLNQVHRCGPGRGNLLGRADQLAGPRGDAGQHQWLEYHRGRH